MNGKKNSWDSLTLLQDVAHSKTIHVIHKQTLWYPSSSSTLEQKEKGSTLIQV